MSCSCLVPAGRVVAPPPPSSSSSSSAMSLVSILCAANNQLFALSPLRLSFPSLRLTHNSGLDDSLHLLVLGNLNGLLTSVICNSGVGAMCDQQLHDVWIVAPAGPTFVKVSYCSCNVFSMISNEMIICDHIIVFCIF